MSSKIKYVMLIIEDKIPKRKLPTVICHLTAETMLYAFKNQKIELVEKWQRESPYLIVLKVSSEKELLNKTSEARDKGIQTILLQYGSHESCKSRLERDVVTFDTNLWEPGKEGEYMASAIGPDLTERIDEITGKLSLHSLFRE